QAASGRVPRDASGHTAGGGPGRAATGGGPEASTEDSFREGLAAELASFRAGAPTAEDPAAGRSASGGWGRAEGEPPAPPASAVDATEVAVSSAVAPELASFRAGAAGRITAVVRSLVNWVRPRWNSRVASASYRWRTNPVGLASTNASSMARAFAGAS